MTLKLHNTLTKKTDDFAPASSDRVTLYTCGPTVYNFPHVGNWAGYIYWDTLIRTLKAHDYSVERVMNITDVGHLVSDEDEGEDKLRVGAEREKKNYARSGRFLHARLFKRHEATQPHYTRSHHQSN